MASNQVLTAKVLTVVAGPLNAEYENYAFPVYEFPNGLILVPGETTHDWFFEDRDSIEACGNDVVVSVEDSDRVEEWTASELLQSIQGSIETFGVDAVPGKYLELLK